MSLLFSLVLGALVLIQTANATDGSADTRQVRLADCVSALGLLGGTKYLRPVIETDAVEELKGGRFGVVSASPASRDGWVDLILAPIYPKVMADDAYGLVYAEHMAFLTLPDADARALIANAGKGQIEMWLRSEVGPEHKVTFVTVNPGSILRIDGRFHLVIAKSLFPDATHSPAVTFPKFTLLEMGAEPKPGDASQLTKHLVAEWFGEFKLDGKIVRKVRRVGEGNFEVTSSIKGGRVQNSALFERWHSRVTSPDQPIHHFLLKGYRAAE